MIFCIKKISKVTTWWTSSLVSKAAPTDSWEKTHHTVFNFDTLEKASWGKKAIDANKLSSSRFIFFTIPAVMDSVFSNVVRAPEDPILGVRHSSSTSNALYLHRFYLPFFLASFRLWSLDPYCVCRLTLVWVRYLSGCWEFLLI